MSFAYVSSTLFGGLHTLNIRLPFLSLAINYLILFLQEKGIVVLKDPEVSNANYYSLSDNIDGQIAFSNFYSECINFVFRR